MGIKMDLGEADRQAQSIKEVMAARIAAYDQAIAALEQFIAASDLQGQAYSNAKGYAEGKLLPFYRGLKALAQAMLDNHDKFPTTYRSTVGEESLDEDKLTEQISDLKQSIESLEASRESLEVATKVGAVAGLAVLETVTQAFDAHISALATERHELEQKLLKLRTFAASSSGLINGIEPLIAAVQQGEAEIDQDYANFGGSFPTLQKGQSPDWAKTINKYVEEQKKRKYEQLNVKEQKAYNEIRKKVEAGQPLDQALAETFKGLDEELRNNLIDELLKQTDKMIVASPSLVKQLQKMGLTWELIKQVKAYASGIDNMPVGIGANMVTTVTEIGETATGMGLKTNSSSIIGNMGGTALTALFAGMDYENQIKEGADVEDAAIKTGAHVGLSIASAQFGAMVGSVIPIGGTFVGAAIGFAVGSLASWALNNSFDEFYDDYLEKPIEGIKNGIGDAVKGVSDFLGSVFN